MLANALGRPRRGRRVVRAVRRRYLALVADGPPPAAPALEARVLAVVARRLAPALAAQVRPRLFHLRPGAAIVRLEPSTVKAIAADLQGLRVGDATLRTVTTSGTLRQAKAALGVRQSARRRRGPRGAGPRAPGGKRGRAGGPATSDVRRAGNP